MNIGGNTFSEAYAELLTQLLRAPKAAPRGRETRELIGVRLWVRDTRQNILLSEVRNLNYRFMVSEWLWILAGDDAVEPVARYNSQVRQFSDDGRTFTGAYGPRLRSQWDYVLNCLTEPQSRQAVAGIWRWPQAPSRDVPCTLSLQFLVRFDRAAGVPRLHTVATMRSSDAWLGLPYDTFSFTMLANWIAARLRLRQPETLGDLRLGEFILNAGSSHLYEEHWERAKNLLSYDNTHTGRSPQLDFYPPTNTGRGSFRDVYALGFVKDSRGMLEHLRNLSKLDSLISLPTEDDL